MTPTGNEPDAVFRDAVEGLRRGDFSRLAPLFEDGPAAEGGRCRIVEWSEGGHFDDDPAALAEAFTCACFLGQTGVAATLLARGADPSAGTATGMDALHWAADRGQLGTVAWLIERKVPLESVNMYGGTALGATVWSAIHKLREDHPAIIEALVRAGARLDASGYPTGVDHVDDLLRRLGAGH